MGKMLEWLSTHTEELARAQAKKQFCLALIAGGDSPEQAGERLGLDLKLVEIIIALDMLFRTRRRIK